MWVYTFHRSTSKRRTFNAFNISLPQYDYHAEIFVGTPPQKFRINIDSGSCHVWLHSSKCAKTQTACQTSHLYDSSISSSYRQNGRPFQVNYLRARASGFISADVFRLGNFTVMDQEFGEIVDSKGMEDGNFDGVMGLGYQCRGPSPLNHFKNKNYIKQRQFSILLSSVNGDTGSQLVFGGADPTHYVGNMHFFPVRPSTHWKIHVESVSMPSNGFSVGPFAAYLDSGSTYIMGPAPIIRSLAIEYLNMIRYRETQLYWTRCTRVPDLPVIGFTMRDIYNQLVMYTLHPQHYIRSIELPGGTKMCVLGFEGIAGTTWILGDTFMRQYYTYHNIEDGQVGMARVAAIHKTPTV